MPPRGSSSSRSFTAGRPSCRAASGSGWRWRAPSSARRACSSWTSRSPTSTRSSAPPCGPSSSTCSASSRSRPIYVTHDQVEAMTLADRIVVMKAGVLQQVGAPADVYDRPANTFVASFVGSPPMNLLRGEAADGLFRHPAAAADVAVAAAGPVILGQRPEELSLAAPGEGDLTGTVYSAELLGDFHPGHGRGRTRPRRGQGRQDLPGPYGRPGRRGAGPHPAPPVRARGRDATRPARAATERGRNAMRFATAETPVLPPERAPGLLRRHLLRHRGCSIRKVSRSARTARSGAAARTARSCGSRRDGSRDRGDRQHGRLHARPRLRRRGGPLRLRPQARLRLPPRPREPAARALHPARHRDPELSRGRPGAGLPLRLGQPPLRRSRARASGATTSRAARAGSGTTGR